MIPNVKAISVAVGMAHPFVKTVPDVNVIKIRAGKATPNNAEMEGNIILLGVESSPVVTSFFMSIAT
jgi:hypothetical protein